MSGRHDDLVSCETVAAIVLHARRIGPRLKGVAYGGHTDPRPLALCGAAIDWDTTRPATEACVTCRSCRIAAGWSEWMVRP